MHIMFKRRTGNYVQLGASLKPGQTPEAQDRFVMGEISKDREVLSDHLLLISTDLFCSILSVVLSQLAGCAGSCHFVKRAACASCRSSSPFFFRPLKTTSFIPQHTTETSPTHNHSHFLPKELKQKEEWPPQRKQKRNNSKQPRKGKRKVRSVSLSLLSYLAPSPGR